MKKYRVTLDPELRSLKYFCGGREFTARRDGSKFVPVAVYMTDGEMDPAIEHDGWLLVEELSPDEQQQLSEKKKCLLPHGG